MSLKSLIVALGASTGKSAEFGVSGGEDDNGGSASCCAALTASLPAIARASCSSSAGGV